MATTTANSLQTYLSSLTLTTSPSPPPPPPAPLLAVTAAAAALHSSQSNPSPPVSTPPAPAKPSCSPSLPNPSSTLLRQTLTCHCCHSPRYPPSSSIKNRFFVDTGCCNDSPVCARCGHKCVGCEECREHYWARVWECWACGRECLRGGCRCGMGWTEAWRWEWRVWRVCVGGRWRAVGEGEGGEWRLG
ncbi:hypothetical protein EX30DRAFT_249560 [Ascodesmis nigricans]|uniref:Uncharacterized protein n=1 Tax=Ascodesmis nigricans TaxID=341454 RepID=A0A4S2MYA0_9PEZI|nr:hypothetical protein EX30DRAFT_249560 [Ascodesmis nigricans]